jgi:UDP-N-acetylglucosamine--dolichyl-phosphate N-acetylglucosaminephosphotransferase
LAGAGLLAITFIVPLAVVLLAMPPFLKRLILSGKVVDDAHKRPPTKVPSPAGPVLVLGAVAGELVAYFAFGSIVPLAVAAATAVAFAIGLADDLAVLAGFTKPLLLTIAGVPLVLLLSVQPDLYQPILTFPILGPTSSHFTIYTVLALAAFPVVANAFNMMDSFNGQIPGFTLLASLAVVFGVTLRAVYTQGFGLAHLASTLPLVAVAAGFLVYNRYPSKAFDGNSGSLMFGAMFAALAITSGVEIAAMVAIVPSILNSFYILSSVRGLVERRKMRVRPTYIGDDGRMYASTEPGAPVTLVRMLLLDGPMAEKELVRGVLLLTAVSSLLSAFTSVMTWVI